MKTNKTQAKYDLQGESIYSCLNSFLTYYYNTLNTGRITDPVHSVTAADRAGLVSNTKARIEDCRYRTLYPREVKKAMAFPDTYIIKGSGKDVVRQCGNAVTPPAMRELTARVRKALN